MTLYSHVTDILDIVAPVARTLGLVRVEVRLEAVRALGVPL